MEKVTKFIDDCGEVLYATEDVLGKSTTFWLLFGWMIAAFAYN